MLVSRVAFVMLVCCSTSLGAQQARGLDTTKIFWHGDNAQLTDSAKSVMEERLKGPQRTPMMQIVILDTGSSKDSMLVATRLNAIRGFLLRKSVPSSRISVGTRGTGWATDTAATRNIDPMTTWYIVMPPS